MRAPARECLIFPIVPMSGESRTRVLIGVMAALATLVLLGLGRALGSVGAALLAAVFFVANSDIRGGTSIC